MNACKNGRQAYFAFKTSEQLNPITVFKLYNQVVLPFVLYGCVLLCDLRAMDSGTPFQHFIAKHAMGLPCHTKSDMCESLLGFLQITAETDHAKKFCSETTVWESCYKLVVTPQVVSVFIPIDLTKWNRSHCRPNLVSSLHYQRKKRRKQIESWYGTGITNQWKSV